MGVTVNEAKQIISEFYRKNPALKDTKFVVRDKASDINEKYNKPEYKSLQGAYLPKDDTVIIISGNHKNKEDVLKTLKHEVYGHAALYKINIHEKKELLDHVQKLRSNKDFKEIYARVDKQYPKATRYHKAEEVYSYIAEKNPSGYTMVKNPTLKVKSMEDVKKISQHLQNKIISGHAKQKIVPLKNSKEFRIGKNITKEERAKVIQEIKSKHSKNTKEKTNTTKDIKSTHPHNSQNKREKAIKEIKSKHSNTSQERTNTKKDVEVKGSNSFSSHVRITDSLEVKSMIDKLEKNAKNSIGTKRYNKVNTPTLSSKDKKNITFSKSSIKQETLSKKSEVHATARSYTEKKEAFISMKSKQQKDVTIDKSPKGRER